MLQVLLQLVDKSLVAVEEDRQGTVRYRLLETVRQYGQERLDATRGAGDLRQLHLGYFLKIVEAAEPRLEGPTQIAFLDTLDKEHDNLRSALTHASKAGDAEKELRLASALWRFWLLRGYFAEGRAWLEGAISKGHDLIPAVRAKALNGAATLAWHQADYDHATVHFRESLEILMRGWGLGRRRELAQQPGGRVAVPGRPTPRSVATPPFRPSDPDYSRPQELKPKLD